MKTLFLILFVAFAVMITIAGPVTLVAPAAEARPGTSSGRAGADRSGGEPIDSRDFDRPTVYGDEEKRVEQIPPNRCDRRDWPVEESGQ